MNESFQPSGRSQIARICLLKVATRFVWFTSRMKKRTIPVPLIGSWTQLDAR